MRNIIMLLKQFFLIAFLLVIVRIDFPQASTPRYPFTADFTVNAVSYTWENMPAIGLNLINNGFTTQDSLEIRLYFNAALQDMVVSGTPDTVYDLVARLDIGILYDQSNYQIESISDSLRELISKTKPVKIPESYDSQTGEYTWYFPISLQNISLSAGRRVRIDIIWDGRSSLPPYEELTDKSPKYIPGGDDWSWGAKKRSDGYPANFNGIKDTTKEIIDQLHFLESDPYITVYRNGQLIWGLPPDWKDHYVATFDTIPKPKLDPVPYAQIAVPFDEWEDQLVRDSANLKISRVRVNQAGYRPQDQKYFYYVADGVAPSFTVIDKSGNPAGSGTLTSTGLTSSGQFKIRASNDALIVGGGDVRYTLTGPTVSGTIYEGVLPELSQGKYRVAVGEDTSASFVVDEHLYNWVRDALLKFYGVNRCGDSHSWFHKPCHLQDPITGGWHDCGDHIKEGITQGYTAAVLGLAAAVFSDRDQDMYDADQSKTAITDGIPDILYEAKHGTDYILQSYDKAGGTVANMITSVGDFGKDHMWWGPPEYQDNMPVGQGGPPRSARNEVGANILGDFAADLAFVSKLYHQFDSEYADKCLKAAKDIYEYIKANQTASNSSAYNGTSAVHDETAFAAMGLAWATGERTYLNDLCYDKTIGSKAQTAYNSCFEGGWFTNRDPLFYHGSANTDWGNVHAFVLWGFFRLFLEDQQLCTTLGVNDNERLKLIEKTAANLIANLGYVGKGTKMIRLPGVGLWTPDSINYELPWFTQHIQMEWIRNSFQAGDITEMFCYYDIASRIQGMELPDFPSATTNWNAPSVKQILVRQLDYMLGVNPWDVSMIYGIGAKNLNHPHHRASNPELKTTAIIYDYRHLVGALAGGFDPAIPVYDEFASDYEHTETGISATTSILVPVCGLSSTDKYTGTRKQIGNKSVADKRDFRIIQQGRERGFLIRSDKALSSVVVFNVRGQVLTKYNCRSKPLQTLNINSAKGNGFSGGLYFVRVNFADGGSKVHKVNAAR